MVSVGPERGGRLRRARTAENFTVKMFLDSAKVDEIKLALEVWNIDGLTTNPRHVQSSGRPLRRVLEDIARLFEGTDKPVSVEVNPHLADWERIVDEGLQLAALSKNFVIKVGAGEAGFKAIRELSQQKVRTNATLIFSVAQAWHAARSGADYVSPFLGWKEAQGDDVRAFVPETLAMLRHGGYHTQIIAAAIRNARQIVDAAAAGAHCCTAGFAVWQDSFNHPFTDQGQRVFAEAWDATPKD